MNEMSPHDSAAAPPPALPLPKTATWADLYRICDAPLTVVLPVRGELLRFVGRRLRPPEVGQLRAILDAAMPPAKPGATPGAKEIYDLQDPAFLAQVEAQWRLARAYCLFRAWPIFGEQAPPELDRNDVPACADWLDASPIEIGVLNALFEPVREEVVGSAIPLASFF